MLSYSSIATLMFQTVAKSVEGYVKLLTILLSMLHLLLWETRLNMGLLLLNTLCAKVMISLWKFSPKFEICMKFSFSSFSCWHCILCINQFYYPQERHEEPLHVSKFYFLSLLSLYVPIFYFMFEICTQYPSSSLCSFCGGSPTFPFFWSRLMY